jgi:hypothetical protein
MPLPEQLIARRLTPLPQRCEMVFHQLPSRGITMASITVLAGDFLQGDGDYRDGVFTLRTSLHPWPGITLPLSKFKSLEVANEDSINNVREAIGFGVAGAMLLGPIGAVAGFMLAGKDTEVTFLLTLKDGRKLLIAADSGTFDQISRKFAALHP